MTAPYSAIRSAFVTRLQALPGLPSVAWENMPFTPITGTPYLTPELLPGRPSQGEQGANGQWWYTGLYQISIRVSANGGIATLNTLRDSICSHFKPQSLPAYSGVTVTITAAEVGPRIQETDWQHVPISIYFKTLSTT